MFECVVHERRRLSASTADGIIPLAGSDGQSLLPTKSFREPFFCARLRQRHGRMDSADGSRGSGNLAAPLTAVRFGEWPLSAQAKDGSFPLRPVWQPTQSPIVIAANRTDAKLKSSS